MKFPISIRALAEMLYRTGDLYHRLDATATAEEGIAVQKKLQADRGDDYQREVRVKQEVEHNGVTVTLGGRADGFCKNGREALVDEYKCCRAAFDQVHAVHASVHWAQVRLYAHLLAVEHPEVTRWTVNLIYAHPDSLATQTLSEESDPETLRRFYETTMARLFEFLGRQHQHLQQRSLVVSAKAFPFPEYREGQLASARRIFRALRDGEQFLFEAPTGSGKTLTALFPAVKLLADPELRLFFLTAKSTGQAAVKKASEHLVAADEAFRTITITAKEKCCPIEGMPCDPDRCDRARGYFDRIKDATDELLSIPHADRDAIDAVAASHCVCPFELSLDAGRWADLVICDYNYFFDPMVRLRRFAEQKQGRLLIDEAHQLAPRVSSMLTADIERRCILDASRESLPPTFAKRLRSLDNAVKKVRRPFADRPAGAYACDNMQPVLRAAEKFRDEVAGNRNGDWSLDTAPAFKMCFFAVLRFLKVAESIDAPLRQGYVVRCDSTSSTGDAV